LILPVHFFHDRGIDFVLVGAHFDLHGRGIRSDLPFAEMIKEKQNTEADTDRIGELQYGKTAGALSYNCGLARYDYEDKPKISFDPSGPLLP
jgi:hypothetical protein